MASEQFSLCWDNFHKNMSSGMNSLLENEDLVDVTLAVQGKCLKAHKMVLSVCSPYFKELFKSNPCKHPIVFMKDVSYEALSDLLQFMYQGEVQVSQENLTTFIKTAEALQIKGLTGDGNGSTDPDVTETPMEKPHVEEYKPTPRPKKQQSAPLVTTPSIKRPRLSTSESQVPPAITKTEPAVQSQSDSAVQFKMEPYDQSTNLIDDTGDDNFGDDNLDDTANDDNEDYSMMESSMTGEEEPQAGTSADGAGEGQGRYLVCADYKRLTCKARAVMPVSGSPKDIVVRKAHNHPPCFRASAKQEFLKEVKSAIFTFSQRPLRDIYEDMSEAYLGCSEHKKSGCRGRATMPVGGDIGDLIMRSPHNHPPDVNAEEKEEFVKELKYAVRSDSLANASLKKVYETVAEGFPKAASEVTFKSVNSSLHRWRKNPNM
ncbi:unnamed protein product [Phaedon cochleariae]|uniref:BTB domain-containing protein n=1 Tax=Phaedon cochleariae TaxID=80249 RepID=A0A9N9SHU1_PHACE|nr:unnamed protein product [Phaedon cochleariae]